MTKAEAIHNFWSRFGIPAYEQNSVPQDAELPYIAYSFSTGSFGDAVELSAALWYRDDSWNACNRKTEEICRELDYGGTVLCCDRGLIWLRPGLPFAKSMGDPKDRALRGKAIRVVAEFNTLE